MDYVTLQAGGLNRGLLARLHAVLRAVFLVWFEALSSFFWMPSLLRIIFFKHGAASLLMLFFFCLFLVNM